jgi:hypothetical protein
MRKIRGDLVSNFIIMEYVVKQEFICSLIIINFLLLSLLLFNDYGDNRKLVCPITKSS